MISDSAAKSFNFVIVWKLDRFARNRYDSAMYKNMLKKNGVKVVSAIEGVGETDESMLLEAILEAMAEQYSKQLAQNVRRGMKETALKRNSTGGTLPLGYKIVDKKLAIDERTAPAVKLAFELYSSGHGKKEIADILNEKGYRTNSGKRFNINSFYNTFKNTKYIGFYDYNGIEITCPAIVEKSLFEKCLQITEKNKRNPAHSKAKLEYLLNGKAFCGYCSAPMVGDCGTSRTGERYYYYSCAAKKTHLQEENRT